MTYKNQLINGLKQGFLFYAFSTILIAIQFSFYIVGSPILDYMDLEGWVFFVASLCEPCLAVCLGALSVGLPCAVMPFSQDSKGCADSGRGVALCAQLS